MFHYFEGIEYFDFQSKKTFHLEVSLFQLLLNAKIDSKYVNNFLMVSQGYFGSKKYI